MSDEGLIVEELLDDPMLTAADIPWSSPPVPHLEDVDPLTLSPLELLAHVEALSRETRWLRRVLHEAVAMTARQRDDLTAKSRQIDALRAELRRYTESMCGEGSVCR